MLVSSKNYPRTSFANDVIRSRISWRRLSTGIIYLPIDPDGRSTSLDTASSTANRSGLATTYPRVTAPSPTEVFSVGSISGQSTEPVPATIMTPADQIDGS